MLDVKEIWSSDEKLRIATGLSITEANLVFEDFEEELQKIRRPKNSNSTGKKW